MTFYVIDDHPLMREAMVMLLRRLRPGAEVVEVSHLGKFAAAVKAHGEPDLICLDLKLPDTLRTVKTRASRQVPTSTSRNQPAPPRSAPPSRPCSAPRASWTRRKSTGRRPSSPSGRSS